MQEGQADIAIEGYYHYLNSAVKKGYSGTLIYTKRKPIHVFYGMNKEEHDQEGRLISLEFEDYYVITCYTCLLYTSGIKWRIVFMYKITDLYDLNHTQASSYLQQYEYPWEALKGIKDFIIELGSSLGDDYNEISEHCLLYTSRCV